MRHVRLTAMLIVSLTALTIAPEAGASPSRSVRFDWRAVAGKELNDVAIDAHGNVYAAGITRTLDRPYAAYLAKFGPGGHKRWSRIFAPPASPYSVGSAVAVDARGAIYWGGTLAPNRCEGQGWFVRKLGRDGGTRWTREQPGWKHCRTQAELTDLAVRGNLLVLAAIDESPESLRQDGWVRAMTTGGRVRWQVQFEPPPGVPQSYYDRAADVAISGLGNIYVAGWAARERIINGSAVPRAATVLEKVTSGGIVLWRRAITRNRGRFGAASVDVHGDRVVLATTHGGGYKLWLASLSPGGGLIWKRTWGSPELVVRQGDVAIDETSTIWVVGSRSDRGLGGMDAFVRRYRSGGHLKFSKLIDGPEFYMGASGVAVGNGAAVSGRGSPGVEPGRGFVWHYAI
jgi:hypothetical protein